MRGSLRFVVVLLAGLAALTWFADRLLSRTIESWFETDVAMREKLAVTAAHASLVEHWYPADPALARLLSDIARDERINDVAACDLDGTLLSRTPGFPDALTCASLQPQLLRLAAKKTLSLVEVASRELAGPAGGDGTIHIGAMPIYAGERLLGAVVLVHDLAYVNRREGKQRALLLTLFAVLAAGATAVVLLAARFARRGSLAELMQSFSSLGMRAPTPERMGTWTTARLRELLADQLHGERIVVLANREPYIHTRQPDGSIKVVHPASGLVTALEPVLRACSGVWVAHGAGTADRESADARGRLKVPPGEESYQLRRVWLSEEEEQGYYYGFSNEALWPLCHLADARPIFRAADWEKYREVNRKFADAVCEETSGEDPIILIQDYHFALAPALIRKRLPRATIIGFWHIPWPSAERFGICPWRAELLSGLLGCSILGFHTQLHCNNFLDAVDSFIESRIDRERNAVVQGKGTTLVRPYPISIEWPTSFASELPDAAHCRAEIFAELKLKPDGLLGVGVDRLDYTKGIEERLLAVERLLEREPWLLGRFTFAQLAAPSRTRIPRYAALNDEIAKLADRINQRFARDSWEPVKLLLAHHDNRRVFRFLRAADLCYVSSLHDGMNLVAKEFAAARDDERGVLILSQFTGAARELTEALIVNPYDIEEASLALSTALRMSPEEQRVRMRALRALVADANVYRWAARMLLDADELRRGQRLQWGLAHRLRPARV